MNRYLKLVNFEFNRLWKLFLILAGMIVFFQIIGVIFEAQSYVNLANELIYHELMSKSEFFQQNGKLSLATIAMTMWFMIPIALSIAVLLIYIFFTWYREWLGKNAFSYRLFMLPTARINIYLAKATTIFIVVLSLIALQLLLLPVESQVLQWMVPKEFRIDASIYGITETYYFKILYPNTFREFLLYYGGGMTAVLMVFTAILFERSFRIKGIFYGIIYVSLSLVIFFAPLLVNVFILNNFLYPMELFFMELLAGLIVLAGAILTGHFLIKNKVKV